MWEEPQTQSWGAAGQKSMALTELGQMETLGKKKIPGNTKLWYPKALMSISCSYFCSTFVTPCSKLSIPSCGAGIDFLCLLEGSRTSMLARDKPVSILPETDQLGTGWVLLYTWDNTHKSVVGVTLPPCKRFYQKSFKSVFRVKKKTKQKQTNHLQARGNGACWSR